MASELNNIPSTITISLGLKNEIRKRKGKMTYEQYLGTLLREETAKEQSSTNRIELTEFERTKDLFIYEDCKIIYSYNKINSASNHIFDISIERIVHESKDISIEKVRRQDNRNKQEALKEEYKIYFALLQEAIRHETKIKFKHTGRIEDIDKWEDEFNTLRLSRKAFTYDVKDKLIAYEKGEHLT